MTAWNTFLVSVPNKKIEKNGGKLFSENCFQELFSEQPVSGFAEADAAAADEETEDNKKEETFGKDEEGGDKEDKDYGDGDGDDDGDGDGDGEET